MDQDVVTSWDYINDNYEPDDRIAVLALHHQTGRAVQRLVSARTAATPNFQRWLRYENAQGASIYISVNTLKPNAQGRTKEDFQTIRHIYLDIDNEGPAVLAKVLADARLPQPSYIIQSSPEKFQVLWKVQGFEPAEAEALQRTMVREFGADLGVIDSARVLRIPGFQNKKYETSPKVTAKKGPDTVYTPADFQFDRTYDPLPLFVRNEHRAKASPRLTQSERDWAYAKRALSRGEAPEKVTADITAHRRDKPNAARYAAYTVKKALVILQYETVEKKLADLGERAVETHGAERDRGLDPSQREATPDKADVSWER